MSCMRSALGMGSDLAEAFASALGAAFVFGCALPSALSASEIGGDPADAEAPTTIPPFGSLAMWRETDACQTRH